MINTGQLTVTTAGVAEPFPDEPSGSVFLVSAHPDNVGNVGIGDGVAVMTTALVLAPGQGISLMHIASLGGSGLHGHADNSGDILCWMKLA